LGARSLVGVGVAPVLGESPEACGGSWFEVGSVEAFVETGIAPLEVVATGGSGDDSPPVGSDHVDVTVAHPAKTTRVAAAHVECCIVHTSVRRRLPGVAS
jgi:hypothetical protein